MASSVQIPLVGGTADGQTITVELDSNGRPPLTHHHLGSGGLADAQIYELENFREDAREWRYRWTGPAV
ncbi:hypothetical protein KBX53_25975 [Micromonospora sp. M51]|uniref:Uncharacterized protein n=2 Tax=Micromonospora TaxID=1873 RepID=A0A4Q7UG57_9ACTN|nr:MULTISPECIES: hypothetical protein [Micromonospora]MBQ1014325.1 hypothetical protein [Micromonospora sp. M51]MBQ1030714.1 hypothetical protein [Micromonospora sp. C97]MDG9677425.1 hypothetical protein [Micromonospora sp. DH14]RZT80312.1 hypothetical protein EV382_3559 [Micromonospora violae]GLZ60155.1 hypothetical protein Misp05_37310 [Micromonospora sp. NBRC 107095]